MRQLSFEACCAASGFRCEWDKDFSCFISGAGLYEPLFLEGSITTPRRFADALARELDLPTNAMSNPMIPDEVYVPGSWNDGNIEADIKMWNNALESKETMDQPELSFLTCRLGDCVSMDYVTCQAVFEGRSAKRYTPCDDETIQTIKGEDGKEVKRLLRGKLPAYKGKWLCPLELENTPFWDKLKDAVDFKISKKNVPKLDDVMAYFRKMSLQEESGDKVDTTDDEEDDAASRNAGKSDDEGSDYNTADYSETDGNKTNGSGDEYDTDTEPKPSTSKGTRRQDPVQRRRDWRESHEDMNPERNRRRNDRRGSDVRGEPQKPKGQRRGDREHRREDYRRYDEKPYYKKEHVNSDRRRPQRDDPERRKPKGNRKGIDVGKEYNADLRALFNRSMPDEAIIETLKNSNGKLMRMMQYRDKSTTKPLIQKLKNFRASGPKCRRATPFDVMLREIDNLAQGQSGTAATLFKQLYTDFIIDPDGLGCTNRQALRAAHQLGY